MNSAISSGIEHLRHHFANTHAFIGYLTAGDGGIQRTLEAALALIEGGVNILEIGLPFSDPVADGPIIQRAAARAIKVGTTKKDILWLIAQIRQKSNIPLILFTYLNPILTGLRTDFLKAAKVAGIDGLLIVDCPFEESRYWREKCLAENIAPIYVIAPSTSLLRLKRIDKSAKGFLYYACRKGTTGIRSGLPEDFAVKMQTIQSAVHLPVVTGFGISEQKTAKQVLDYCQGVVVGSLFVKALEEGHSPQKLTQLARSINPLY